MKAKITIKGTDITVEVLDGKGEGCIDFTRFLTEAPSVTIKEQELKAEIDDGPKLMAEMRMT